MYTHIELAIADALVADRIQYAERRRAISSGRPKPTRIRRSLRMLFGRQPVAGTVR
jgi:hypothetical protein